MKKIATLVLGFTVVLTAPAFAGWESDLSTAIASGNADQIAAVAATYPDNQAAIAMEMLSQAKTLLGTNPALAVSVYKSASTISGEVPAESTPTIIAAIKDFLNKAKDSQFQQNYPNLAAVIFSASLTMAALPNVVAIDPNLYEEVLVGANEFLDKKPIESAEITGLNDTVLLAQNAGFTPPGPTGANGAVADPISGTPSVAAPLISAE